MTRAEWDEWKLDASTKAFFGALGSVEARIKQMFVDGDFLSDDPQQTQNNCQRAQGNLEALNNIRGMDYEEYKLTDKDTQDD